MYTERDYNNSLCHYGIKGQTWGNRRFQNTDGTYTALGERRRLEQLARTSNIVRPNSASRDTTVRTGGGLMKTNSTVKRTSTGSGTASTVRKAATPVYGSISTIQSARGKNSTLIAQAAKKKAEEQQRATARIVDAKLAESSREAAGTTKTKKSKSSSTSDETNTKTKKSSASSTDGTGTTSSKKRKSSTKSKSKKQKQQEAEAKKREQEAAKTEEENTEEENKDENNKEAENLTDEQVQDLARRVIRGEFGNGQERKDKLGESYARVQALVNQILLKGKRK